MTKHKNQTSHQRNTYIIISNSLRTLTGTVSFLRFVHEGVYFRKWTIHPLPSTIPYALENTNNIVLPSLILILYDRYLNSHALKDDQW